MVQEKQLTAETVEATRVRLEKARKGCKFVGRLCRDLKASYDKKQKQYDNEGCAEESKLLANNENENCRNQNCA